MSLVLYDSNTSNGLPKVPNVAVTPSVTVYADRNGLVTLSSVTTDQGGNFEFYAPAGEVTVTIERTDYVMTVPAQGSAPAGGGTPGGNPGELQFNNGGAFAGVTGSAVSGAGRVSLGDALDAASVAISTGSFTPGNALTMDSSTPPKIVDSGAAPGGLLFYRLVLVYSDQIKNLIASPVEIIPTPGEGKRLVPTLMRWRTVGTTPYTVDENAQTSLVLGSAEVAELNWPVGTHGVNQWFLPADPGYYADLFRLPLQSAVGLVHATMMPMIQAAADWDNRALVLVNGAASDFAAGDYTLEIAIWYVVETVV